jgi:tetratricopeptide (TPR) repeat protein
MSNSRPTFIRTGSESPIRILVALAACVSLSGCGGPAATLEYENPSVDPLPASTLAGRGHSFEQRQRVAELNRNRDWPGLVQFSEEQQRGDPEGSDWGVIAGYAWLKSRDYPKATAMLSRVTQRNPEDVGAWNLLGETQRLSGQPGRAAQTLEYASTVGRSSFITYFLLGEAYRDASRFDRAVAAYKEAIRLEPGFVRGWFELGTAQLRIGERKEAEATYDQLQKLEPRLGEELRARIQAGKK